MKKAIFSDPYPGGTGIALMNSRLVNLQEKGVKMGLFEIFSMAGFIFLALYMVDH